MSLIYIFLKDGELQVINEYQLLIAPESKRLKSVLELSPPRRIPKEWKQGKKTEDREERGGEKK